MSPYLDREKELRRAARKRKLICLSKKYIKSSTQYLWLCPICDHEWQASHNNIKRGKGCPHCAFTKRRESSQKYSIQDLQKAAAKKSGRCTSRTYLGYHIKHEFICKAGHKFPAPPSTILRGKSWCPYCAGQGRLTLAIFQEIAKERGGKCLSKRYLRSTAKLKFRCSLGHDFEAAASSIRHQKSWCPECRSPGVAEEVVRYYFEKLFNKPFPKVWPDWLLGSKKRPLQLDGYNEKLRLAFEHHGVQHYKSVAFFSGPHNSWAGQRQRDRRKVLMCQKYGIRLVIIPQLHAMTKLEDLPAVISKELRRLGVKFSKSRLSKIKLDLAVINTGSRITLNRFIDVLRARGDSLVSKSYLGYTVKHKVRCGECGEIYLVNPSYAINRGDRCHSCAIRQRGVLGRKGSLEDLVAALKKRNIVLLSTRYERLTDKYSCQCQVCKHKWFAIGRQLLGSPKRHPTGCPACAKKRAGATQRLTLAKMQLLAKKRGGRCLSKAYVNNSTPLRWKCINGHRWTTIPAVILRGGWCRECWKIKVGHKKKERLSKF